MKNKKLKYLFLIFGFISCILSFKFPSFAQDNSKVVALTKQIMESGSRQDLYLAFEELTDLYFSRLAIKSEDGIPPEAVKESKYNEYVEFLNSLIKQKKELEPVVNYYIALTRYYQLKYLEENQKWDEYFSQGNTYRDQIIAGTQKAIFATPKNDALNLYARLILWLFHKGQEDSFRDSALSDLMTTALEYSKDTTNLIPIKDVADRLLSYGEKAEAKSLYRIYVKKLITQETTDTELENTALNFYKENNLELAQNLYDAYIERISKSYPKEKLITILIDIAKLFAYKDKGPGDAFYAEKIFNKIQEAGGEGVFKEELMYLRAFNLEKAKDFSKAKDFYIDLITRYPQTKYLDEATYKVGIIYIYALKEIKSSKGYFEKLAAKEIVNPQVISGLYQLGLLAQWEQDSIKAKGFYNKLLERAGDNFLESVALAKERIKEIDDTKPLEYNLKTFLDACLKEEFAMLNTAKSDLRASLYRLKKDQETTITSSAYMPESGCIQVELQYLWSGQLGKTKPALNQSSFNTSYASSGTKEINLVVVSPTGIIERNFDLLDVY